jgi:peptide/nickel transport system ATP-binding protein
MNRGSRQGRVMPENLLSIDGLKTYFRTDGEPIRAVDGVSLALARGEVFGLVGESGSGKTMTALSIMRLIPVPGRIVEGSITFEGSDLAGLTNEEMQKVRGNRIGMIFQEPLTSLNPVLRIGDQLSEGLIVHKGLSNQEAKGVAVELLGKVGFDQPENRYLQYPHQLSGGQRQRVLIAIAIACNPSLIIADEPTTALDVTIEAQILKLLEALIADRSMSMLFITHNLHLIKRIADRVGIMYAGRMVEEAPVADFLTHPQHPYSRGLLDSLPEFAVGVKRLKAIPGSVPRLSEMPKGCPFHPRCVHAMDRCRAKAPGPTITGENRCVRCFLYET